MSSETGRKRLVAAAAVLLAGGGIWLVLLNQPETDPLVVAVPETSDAAQAETAEIADAPASSEAESLPAENTVESDTETADAEPATVEPELVEDEPEVAEAEDVAETAEEPAEIAAILPSLDTFRVENDGQAVLAGRAGPGALLNIIVGGEVVQRVTADAAGNFFTFLDLSPSASSRSLSVIADPDGQAVAMAQTYFIEPFGVDEPETEIAEAETIPGAVAPVAEEEIAAATEIDSAPETDEAASEEVETTEAEVAQDETLEVQEEPSEPTTEETEIASAGEDDVVEPEATEAEQEDTTQETETTELAEVELSEEELLETQSDTEVSVSEVVEEPTEQVTEIAEAEAAEASEDPIDTAEAEVIEEAVELEANEPEEVATVETEATENATEVVTSEPEEEATVVAEAIEEIFGDALATEEPALEEAEIAEAAVEEQAPTVLEVDETGVRVVASGPGPQALSQVALDTITYDPTGEVLIAGRASTDGFVQVYIDNKPITVSRITRDRNWSTDLPEVDTGIYTLRIDEVDAEGTVVSRLETPFKREEAETVAAVMAEETQEEDFEVAVKTVQPGATLWAIAREKYGRGILYVSVFEANKDLIRDPDLIYPGQIFVLPELEEIGEE